MSLHRMVQKLSRVAAGAALIVGLAGVASATPQPHPRLWLDSTTMARLDASRTANSPEWVALRNWCDGHLGDNLSEGYQYLDWYSYVHNYGLMYRITGDATYGNEGVIYLKALLRDRHAIGDGLGGTNAIQIDSGYVSRSMGVGVAVGRDWLDGAPDLTPTLIEECTTRMGEWYTWLHQPTTFGIDEPWVNYFAGHFAMTYTAFIAFEGDPGYNTAWETKSESMWVLARNFMNTGLDGGDWPEGWNYGHRAMRHMIAYPWALETGTDRADHWDEIDITGELVRSHVSMLHPSRALTSDDGRWTGDYKGDPRSTTCLMMSVLSDTDPTAKGLAKWYANHLAWEPGGPDLWEAMLFTDTSLAEIAPSAATVGGLTWKMYGHAVTRGDDWSNLDATFVDVVAWTDYASEHNFGEFKIASRQQPLLVDGQTWQLEGEYTNMPRITGTHTYAPYQELWHDTSVMTAEGQDTVYTYFKMANLEHLYDGVHNDDPSAAAYQRDVVFVAPDHVIAFDNITATSLSNTITEQWHLMGNPVISGDTATLTAGAAKLFLRTLSPAVTLSKFDTDATRDGTWRVDVAMDTPAIHNRILTVFEASAAAQTDMTPVEVIAGAGMTGVYIKDPAGPVIVLFPIVQNGSQTSATFSFEPVATNTRVILTGMQASSSYLILSSPGVGGLVDVNASVSGTGPTSGANGSLTFEVNTASGVDDWFVE
ncbi:hypothetical protein GC173_18305 [bacterium]|nr:hypothetical protein [bacterium]